MNPLWILLKFDFQFSSLGVRPGFGVANKLPGEAGDAVHGPHFENLSLESKHVDLLFLF